MVINGPIFFLFKIPHQAPELLFMSSAIMTGMSLEFWQLVEMVLILSTVNTLIAQTNSSVRPPFAFLIDGFVMVALIAFIQKMKLPVVVIHVLVCCIAQE